MECKRYNGAAKSEEMVDVFRMGKFELFVLTEKTLEGSGEVSWCGVNGIIAIVQEIERAREGVFVLINNELHSVVIGFGCVNYVFKG